MRFAWPPDEQFSDRDASAHAAAIAVAALRNLR